jgi:beta-glucosidase
VTLAVLLSGCTGDPGAAETTTTSTVAPAATTTTVTSPPPATDSGITLTAFSDHLFGIEGLVPEGWTETEYGVLIRDESPADPAFLALQAAPGATASDVLGGLTVQLGLSGRPDPAGTTTTDHLTWTHYPFEAVINPLGEQLLKGDAAIAESDYGGFLVAFAALPAEYESLAEHVFRPAVQAFVPPQQLPPPEPSAAYRDESAPIETRVEDLLGRMTLAEKIGQMTQVEKNSIQPGAITLFGIGSVLSGGGGSPADNSPEGWAKMTGGFQAEADATRLGIPLIYGVDAVHGHNNVRGATVFPHNVGLGAANDPDLMRRIGEITAREVAATGIHWNFAPTLAVPQDMRWGRTYEGFGEDAGLVGPLGAAYLEGLQGDDLSDGQTVLATAKHFVGDGGTSWGSATTGAGLIDQGVTEVDEATLRRIHLSPYEAVAAAFIAGIDMNMVPYNYGRFIWTLWRAVDNGDVPIERIDDAVRRILRVKFELGLFESDYSDPSLLATVGSAEHRAVAREAVAKSLVLLKDDDDLLPISDTVEVIFVGGQAADDIGIQSGGWTIEWQGRAGNITPGTTILEGIQATVAPGVEVHYDRFGNLDRLEDDGTIPDPDLCIGVIGERPYAEYEGDSPDLTLISRDVAVLDNLDRFCERVVVVLVSGRPLIVTDRIDGWDAVVAAWLPGTEGQGVADVLFGLEPFRGRLPYTWPRSIDQVPLSALEASNEEPLFPFGYGLEG